MPDRPAAAVRATLAAHRLEEWRPSDQHVDALVAAAAGRLSLDHQLASFRSRHPAPVDLSPTVAASRGAVLVPESPLLRNRFGVISAAAPANLEYVAPALGGRATRNGRRPGWLHIPVP